MNIESISDLGGVKKKYWIDFLRNAGLEPDDNCEQTVLLWDDGKLIGTGSRQDNLLKCIAVDPSRQGEGLMASIITSLRQDAFAQGHRHLFLYTKPTNEYLFRSLFFYPVAKTADVLLMEDRKDGIRNFLDSLPTPATGSQIGAAVMNCDPFTLGHQYLIESAAAECDHLYVFVLSEDKGLFNATERMEMVKAGSAHLSNVTVLPTGPYLISSATFPTYFLKDRDQAESIHCLLDIEIFCKHFASKFGITRRYVGTEPLSKLTNLYNDALKTHLTTRNIELQQIPRLEQDGAPISASAVRKHLQDADWDALASIVPPTTLACLKDKYLRR